jgi:hypothetical protein
MNFEQRLANLLMRDIGVGELTRPRARQGSDDRVEGHKRRDDSPGVDGGEVRDVVEYPAKDDVVGPLVHGRCDQEEDRGGDVNSLVGIVVRPDRTRDEARGEQAGRPDEH